MNPQSAETYFYLNPENSDGTFQTAGLDRLPEGGWRLAAVPRLERDVSEDFKDLPSPNAPSGLAVSPAGTLYYSQPEQKRLMRLDPCAAGEPSVCISPDAGAAAHLEPRGLLYHPQRRGLFVAGGAAIYVFDPQSWQLLEVWGRPGEPGVAPVGPYVPWSLAADGRGNVYVANPEAGQIHAFDMRGRSWRRFQPSESFERPVAVAITSVDDSPYLLVLDAGPKMIVMLDLIGQVVGRFGADVLQDPLVLAVTGRQLFVGDNALRQVLQFRLSERPGEWTASFSGSAHGYRGPVAALAVDLQDGLWLHPGGETPPLRLALEAAYARSGILWAGPFGPGGHSVRWHRLRAGQHGGESGGHLQLFVHGSQLKEPGPLPPQPDHPMPFNASDWAALPLDAADVLLPDTDPTAGPNQLPEAVYLWVGLHLTGDGLSTSIIQRLRVDYDHPTYRQHLPPIFSLDSTQVALLDRLLALFESFYGEAETQIEELVRYFDPKSVPANWLGWLAGWLGLDLEEAWPVDMQRQAIRQAMAYYAQRGTSAGLRAALRFFAGVEAHLAEPVQAADWWMLPAEEATPAERQVAVLGFSTRLAPIQPEGAVLGSSAVLDGATLSDEEEAGRPLFENLAHQFTVQVYRGQVQTADEIERVQRVIEREKPAHTLVHLCVIEPRLRIGFQARVGIDTVVAGPAAPRPLDETVGVGDMLVLGGEPPGQVGSQSRVGQDTRLAAGR